MNIIESFIFLKLYAKIKDARILIITIPEDSAITLLEHELKIKLKQPYLAETTTKTESGANIIVDTNIKDSIYRNKHYGRNFHYILVLGYYDYLIVSYVERYLSNNEYETIPKRMDMIF